MSRFRQLPLEIIRLIVTFLPEEKLRLCWHNMLLNPPVLMSLHEYADELNKKWCLENPLIYDYSYNQELYELLIDL
jgi:hypothetical protein